MNKFDKEYYVMSVGGVADCPSLTFGDTDCEPFILKNPIDVDDVEIPIKIIFDDDYSDYEITDLLILDAQYAISEKLKNILEHENVYGVQFFPIEIETDDGDIILGYYAMHIWNRLAVVDRKNYRGGKADELGLIMDLQSFSLNEKLFDKTPPEQRKLIRMTEDPSMLLIHQSIHDAIIADGLTGIRMFRVDEWNTSSYFR